MASVGVNMDLIDLRDAGSVLVTGCHVDNLQGLLNVGGIQLPPHTRVGVARA